MVIDQAGVNRTAIICNAVQKDGMLRQEMELSVCFLGPPNRFGRGGAQASQCRVEPK